MSNIIVSCTTTFERIHLFYYSVQSLLSQIVKPDIFLLNISSSGYMLDSGFSDIPDFFKKPEITINWVENTGSYRKLLPAIDITNEDDLVITADDDVLYGPNWLKDLLECARSDPESIICPRARKIRKNIFGDWQSYANWDVITSQTKGMDILPIGCAGVVYRKKQLDLDFLKQEMFMEIAPTTDDLWFRASSMRCNTPISVAPRIDRNNVYLTHNLGLENININKTIKGFWVRHYSKQAWIRFANYLGVNHSKNDSSWKLILEFSKSKPAS